MVYNKENIMLKNSFKQLLKLMLLVFLGFTTNANADYGAIEGNYNINQAFNIGPWEYHGGEFGFFKAGEKEAYFSFMSYNGTDRVYARTWDGYTIEQVDSNGDTLKSSVEVIHPTTFPYINIDATTKYKTIYVKVSRDTDIGEAYYGFTVDNRIKTSFKTFEFTGTASNPGGATSSEVYMDLSNNDDIPNNAIVTSIKTDGDLDKSLGGVVHQIFSGDTNNWYTAIVSGIFAIDVSNNLQVKQVWRMRYSHQALSSSNMDNIEADIRYEYDLTEQF